MWTYNWHWLPCSLWGFLLCSHLKSKSVCVCVGGVIMNSWTPGWLSGSPRHQRKKGTLPEKSWVSKCSAVSFFPRSDLPLEADTLGLQKLLSNSVPPSCFLYDSCIPLADLFMFFKFYSLRPLYFYPKYHLQVISKYPGLLQVPFRYSVLNTFHLKFPSHLHIMHSLLP